MRLGQNRKTFWLKTISRLKLVFFVVLFSFRLSNRLALVFFFCSYFVVFSLSLDYFVYWVRAMQQHHVADAYFKSSYFNRICVEIAYADWLNDMPLEYFKAKCDAEHFLHAMCSVWFCLVLFCWELLTRALARTASNKWLIRWHFYIRLLAVVVSVGRFFSLHFISRSKLLGDILCCSYYATESVCLCVLYLFLRFVCIYTAFNVYNNRCAMRCFTLICSLGSHYALVSNVNTLQSND